MRDLIEPFQNYFEIKIADTAGSLEQVYRLRYEVFCKEFHFEREENCPRGFEHDDFDAQSTHLLIIHRASAVPAGCVRLVNTRQDDPLAPLPMERYCGHSLYQQELHPSRLPRESLCETSRLAVFGHFRRRPGESESPLGNVLAGLKLDRGESRLFPLIGFTLSVSVVSLMLHTERQDMLAMMEPWLLTRFRTIGISVEKIGEPTDYHGIRVAGHITLKRFLQDVDTSPLLQDAFNLINPLIAVEFERIKQTKKV